MNLLFVHWMHNIMMSKKYFQFTTIKIKLQLTQHSKRHGVDRSLSPTRTANLKFKKKLVHKYTDEEDSTEMRE